GRQGQWGNIPGSARPRFFFGKGKGEPQSFESCAHGAGRIMSHAQARKQLDVREEVQALKEQGILHAIRSRRDLDEAPGSYKDIDEVMNNQRDLVEIQIELQPLAVVKG